MFIYYNNSNYIITHSKLGLLQSNLVLVIGIILLIPFNSFSETSVYMSSSPS